MKKPKELLITTNGVVQDEIDELFDFLNDFANENVIDYKVNKNDNTIKVFNLYSLGVALEVMAELENNSWKWSDVEY